MQVRGVDPPLEPRGPRYPKPPASGSAFPDFGRIRSLEGARYGRPIMQKKAIGARAAGAKRGLVLAIGGVVCAAALHCGAASKQQSITTVLEAMSSEQRRSNFEDTARVLDQHAEWVDEFYSVARAHPAMMRRFLQNASFDLKKPEMAGMTAELLVQVPPSLRQMMVSTVDATKPNPEARRAMDQAIAERAEPVADMIADDPATVTAVVRGLLVVVDKKPAAKRALVSAVNEESGRVVALAASDPKLVAALTRPILEAAMKDRESLLKLLKELKLL
jgi:hypothetical protein